MSNRLKLFPEFDDNLLEDETDLGDVDILSSIQDITTTTVDFTVSSILDAFERNVLRLDPKFQRRDAWDPVRKSKFIESLIYGLPVPQLVFAEDNKDKKKFIVVDGKQRLISLLSFLSNDPGSAFFLEGLKSKSLNGKSAGHLRRELPELYNNLLDQPIRCLYIRNWKDEKIIYTIFYRLNSGSLNLSAQELRKAIKNGPFMDILDEHCENSLQLRSIFKEKGTKTDSRMRDLDLLLRYFLFTKFLNVYSGNYKDSADAVCDHYNKYWSPEVEHEVRSHLNLFDRFLGAMLEIPNKGQLPLNNVKKEIRKPRRFSRSIFDLFLVYGIPLFSEKGTEIFPLFNVIIADLEKEDKNFQKAISSNTNNLKETSTRIVLFGQRLKKLTSWNVNIPAIMLDYFKEKDA